MGEITPNVVADFDDVLDTPAFIRSTTAFLTRRSTRTATQVVADFVNDNPATFGVSLGGGATAGAASRFSRATEVRPRTSVRHDRAPRLHQSRSEHRLWWHGTPSGLQCHPAGSASTQHQLRFHAMD